MYEFFKYEVTIAQSIVAQFVEWLFLMLYSNCIIDNKIEGEVRAPPYRIILVIL